MKRDKIKQQLESYWQCETSIEEEQLLEDFFTGDPVPEELKKYQTLFVWKNKQKAAHGAPVQPVVTKRRLLKRCFYPAIKIAASVLALLLLGISSYTHYRREKFMDDLFYGTASDTLDIPKDSIAGMATVLLWEATEEDTLRLEERRSCSSESEEE